MPFRKFFTFAKRVQTISDAVDGTPIIDKREEPFDECRTWAQSQAEVHVKMDFDKFGNLVMREVEYFKVIEVPTTPYSAATFIDMSQTSTLSFPLPEADKKRLSADAFLPVVSKVLPLPLLNATALTTAFVEEVHDAPTVSRKIAANHLRVVRFLGSGQHGAVHLVHDRVTAKLLAIKSIRKQNLSKDQCEDIFTERYALRRLAGSPCITALRASFEDDKYFHLLTDYYSRGDLCGLISDEGCVPVNQARIYAAQLLLALQKCHEQRIIHCDIKPDNILINGRNQIVLADFGLCGVFGHSDEGGDEGPKGDVIAHPCGTAIYSAPEVLALLLGKDWSSGFTYSADVWSYGVVIFVTLHGGMPFGMTGDDDLPAIAHKIMYEPLDAEEEDIGAVAASFLRMILKKDPEQRPTWNQIQKHEWFAGIDWSTISGTLQTQRPISTLAKDLDSMVESVSFEFGGGYTDGEAPHPYFEWVSDDLCVSPSVSASSLFATMPSSASLKWLPTSNSNEAVPASKWTNFPPCKASPEHRPKYTICVAPSTHEAQSCIVYADASSLAPSWHSSSASLESLAEMPCHIAPTAESAARSISSIRLVSQPQRAASLETNADDAIVSQMVAAIVASRSSTSGFGGYDFSCSYTTSARSPFQPGSPSECSEEPSSPSDYSSESPSSPTSSVFTLSESTDNEDEVPLMSAKDDALRSGPGWLMKLKSWWACKSPRV